MPNQAALELVAVLATEKRRPSNAFLIARDAQSLARIAKRIERRAVLRCNGDERISRKGEAAENAWSAKLDAADARDQARVNTLVKVYRASCIIGGDPRGYTLKLVLASGRTNDMGRDGWGVPTS